MDYDGALKAVQELFSNKDYTLKEALENMQGLQREIGSFISCLEHDIEQAGA